MAQYREYQAPIVGQNKCSYSSLGSTYAGPQAGGVIPDMSTYIVPKLCYGAPAGLSYPPRYDTLSHGQAYLCGGHFDLQRAYPLANCTSCAATYVERPCRGTIYAQCGDKQRDLTMLQRYL
jgi:hypothetical protein